MIPPCYCIDFGINIDSLIYTYIQTESIGDKIILYCHTTKLLACPDSSKCFNNNISHNKKLMHTRTHTSYNTDTTPFTRRSKSRTPWHLVNFQTVFSISHSILRNLIWLGLFKDTTSPKIVNLLINTPWVNTCTANCAATPDSTPIMVQQFYHPSLVQQLSHTHIQG